MKPSEVREQILADHRQVMRLLDEVEEEARSVLASRGNGDRLRDRAFELERSMADMIEREQALLEPVLRGTDAFGEVRAEQLHRSHRRQREALATTREEAAAGRLPARDLAGSLCDVIARVRADLEKEQQRSLDPNLLRDDVVVVSQSDG